MRLSDLRNGQEVVLRHDVTHVPDADQIKREHECWTLLPAGRYRVELTKQTLRIETVPPTIVPFHSIRLYRVDSIATVTRYNIYIYLESRWAEVILRYMDPPS